ncbi:MAG: alpha/beta hydrolase [Bacteroidales bacterium]|jgi:acetyl esterase/lipase|nr:alpha/beta hydrolase [Bacteroidales bacterium]
MKNSRILIFFFAAALAPNLFLSGQETARGVAKQTLVYADRDGKELRMDRYCPENMRENMPCVIFMHGGSFRGGARDAKSYLACFDDLAAHGYTVLSIDYRLGLKNAKPKNMQEIIAALKHAVDMAVEDLYDASRFVLEHAGEWKIDAQKIVIGGSSAGAIAVLQAEYERCNQTEAAARLPHGFRYAGVIGFAGAVLSQGDLQCREQPAPALLFHGDCDRTVPFDRLAVDKVNMLGSQEIARQLQEAGAPCCLYRYVGSGHEIANRPMTDNLPEIRRFLELWVINRQPLIWNIQVQGAERKAPCPTLQLEDFIQSNFK